MRRRGQRGRGEEGKEKTKRKGKRRERMERKERVWTLPLSQKNYVGVRAAFFFNIFLRLFTFLAFLLKFIPNVLHLRLVR